MYDASAHVRVRILSSKNFPISFASCLQSNVKEDKTPEFLKPSTYSKGIDAMKAGISGIFTKTESPLEKFRQ